MYKLKFPLILGNLSFMKLSKSFLLLTLLFSVKIFAWGTTGHRVVAEIAERNLTSHARRNLKKIIGHQKLAYWANWPDFIKSDTTGVWKAASAWHYVNIRPQKDFKTFSDSLKAEAGPNLYTQIKALSLQVRDKSTSARDREIALRFIIHLVGDLAQPLHVGHAEDKGGNDIKLTYFGQPTNLHSVWDDKLIDAQKYSYTEYADVLLKQDNQNFKEIAAGTLEEWFYDSNKMAEKIYKNSPAGGSYSFDYNYKFNELLNRQLLYGGLRLAKVLNEIL